MEMNAKVRNFDLNLLTVFVAIDEQRHITKAAATLGMTQPALSHALGRLRILLKDQLFVKSSRGMVPTPKAQGLSAPIRGMLAQFEHAVLGQTKFDPQTVQKTFRIATTDLIETLLLPSLLKIVQIEAPGIRLLMRPSAFSLPKPDLELGILDLAIGGFFGDLPDGFYQQKLFSDSFVSVVRKDHPRLGKSTSLTLDDFCRETHILIAPGGELQGRVDDLLRKKKRNRVVVAGINSFMSATWIVPKTDSILTGPSRLIGEMSRAFPMKIFAPPLDIPSISIVQSWHERNHQDPSHRWMRERIRSVLQN